MTNLSSIRAQLQSLAKSICFTLTLVLLIICTLSFFFPPELLIFIQESKSYRITELAIVSLILLLLGKKIVFRFKESAFKRETFIDRKKSKEEFQREVLKTTQAEIKKLKESKDYQRWQESNINRQNNARIDKEDEIMFSDEEVME